MADYTPVYSGGAEPSSHTTSAAVTGGRLVAVSGNGTVAHAGAASTTIIGVAAFDVAASGGRVMVWPLVNVIHELEASAAITAAAGVEAAANGQVATVATSIAASAAAGSLIGIATTTAAGSPLKVRFVGRA